jgi:hypothetical protein
LAHGVGISRTLILVSEVASDRRRRLSYRCQFGERTVGLPRTSKA